MTLHPPSYFMDEVKITLTSHDAPVDELFRERVITLTKDKPSVNIGRSSSRNVDLSPANDNGWVDAPTMSREHAKVTFVPASKKFFVKDIGSLHGTYVNDKRIGQFESHEIHHGDYIRFGIAITKGSFSFAPRVMQVCLIHEPQSRPAVFRVPDSSDDEDESSDIENVINESVDAIKKSGIEAAPSRVAKDSTIDLTIDDLGDVGAEVTLLNSDIPLAMPSSEAVHLASDSAAVRTDEAHDSGQESECSDEVDDDVVDDDDDDDDEADNNSEIFCQSLCSNSSSWMQTPEERQNESARDATIIDPFLEGSDEEDLDFYQDGTFHSLAEDVNMPEPVGLSSDTEDLNSSQPNGANLATLIESAVTENLDIEQPAGEANNAANIITDGQAGQRRLEERQYFEVHGQNPLSNNDNIDRNGFNLDQMPGSYKLSLDDTPTKELLESGEKFLTQPPQETHHVRTVSEDVFDKTSSAHMFEVTKRAMETQKAADKESRQAPRDDEDALVRGKVSRSMPKLSKKRKADEMCTNESAQIPAVQTTTSQSTPAVIPPTVFSPQTTAFESRPVKRLRKVVEAVGYAALGGVAVISALIATAPALE